MLKSAWQLPIIFVALTIAAPARAADIWVAANVHGSVFELLNDQWRELKNGDGIASGIAVRTLQAGRVRLVRQGQVLALDPNTAIVATGGGAGVTVQQYAGTVTLTGADVARAQLVTPAVVATISGASLVSRVSGRSATLSVGVGRVPVSARGRRLVLSAGQTILFDSAAPLGSSGNSASGKAPDSVGSDSPVGGITGTTGSTTVEPPGLTTTGAGAAGGVSGGAGASTDSDNGLGNGGTRGNGRQNGNGNGKSQK